MVSTFSDRVQAIQGGPLLSELNAKLWFDNGRGVLSGYLPGLSVTLFDARPYPDKDSWRSPIANDVKRSCLVLLLGWGAGKGQSALPRFNQEAAVKMLHSIRYDPEAHAVLISITSHQLTNWLAFLGDHCPADCEVWSLSVGRPVRLQWEGQRNG